MRFIRLSQYESMPQRINADQGMRQKFTRDGAA